MVQSTKQHEREHIIVLREGGGGNDAIYTMPFAYIRK